MVDLQKLVRDPFAAGQAAGASKMRPMVTLPVGLPAETCALDVEVDELDVLPPDVAEDVRAEEYCAICDPGLQEESADESDSDGIGVAEAGAPEVDNVSQRRKCRAGGHPSTLAVGRGLAACGRPWRVPHVEPSAEGD